MANTWKATWDGNTAPKFDTNDQWNEGGDANGATNFNENSGADGFGEGNEDAGFSGGASGGCFNCGEGIYHSLSIMISLIDTS